MLDIESITLPNPGPVMTTYIVVNHRPHEGEWEILSVEVCADSEGRIVLGDCSMNEIPRDLQQQLYTALAVHSENARRNRGLRHLLRDLQELSAADKALLINGEIHVAPITAQVCEVPQL